MKECLIVDINNQVIINIVNIISRFKHVERVILFGSYADGTNTEHSDINIAVMAHSMKPVNWQTLIVSAQRVAEGIELDINRVEKSGDYLLERLAKDGIVLYNKQNG